MRFPLLSKRMEQLKYSDEEVKNMCQAMEITYQEGLLEGRAEGRKEGRREGMLDIALRMLQAGRYKVDEIAALTGLTPEQVLHLSGS